MDTSFSCISCDEDIETGETIVQACLMKTGKYRTQRMLDQLDDLGQYLVTPYYLHCDCFDEIRQRLLLGSSDTPQRHDIRMAVLCSLCKNSIMVDETLYVMKTGEFKKSPRMPNGEPYFLWEANNALPVHICADCFGADEEFIEMFKLQEFM